MAYNGYRLKINNNIFENVDMARGSWSISTAPRLCESYVDAVGISHDIFYPTPKTIIKFAIREHIQPEHERLAGYFTQRQNVVVEYFDEETNGYKTGTFRVQDIEWNHTNAGGAFVDYSTTAVTLEEY